MPLPALAVWLASRPQALTDRSASIAAASHAGHRLAVELAVVGAAAGGGRGRLRDVRRPGQDLQGRADRRARAVVAIALVAGLAGFFAHYGSPSKIAHRTYHSFTGPPTGGQNLNSRLFSFSNNGRTVLWHAAWNEFRAHPVAGGGAGSFQRWWLAHRTNGYYVTDAHNLYAQTLGELGLIGGALLALFLGLPLVAAVRARWHPLAGNRARRLRRVPRALHRRLGLAGAGRHAPRALRRCGARRRRPRREPDRGAAARAEQCES